MVAAHRGGFELIEVDGDHWFLNRNRELIIATLQDIAARLPSHPTAGVQSPPTPADAERRRSAVEKTYFVKYVVWRFGMPTRMNTDDSPRQRWLITNSGSPACRVIGGRYQVLRELKKGDGTETLLASISRDDNRGDQDGGGDSVFGLGTDAVRA